MLGLQSHRSPVNVHEFFRPNSNAPVTEVYCIKPSPGKGLGVFATRALEPGKEIMRDKAVMIIPRPPREFRNTSPEEVQQAFSQLSKAQRRRFFQLHEGRRALPTKLLRIYKANAFGNEKNTRLYLEISRFNHSCTPNAELTESDDKSTGRIVACKPIAKGEEICICYYGDGNNVIASHRRKSLRAFYGFECSCSSCTLEPRALWTSDFRRELIRNLSCKLRGFEPSEFRGIDDLNEDNVEQMALYVGFSKTPLRQPLTLPEQTACAFMLAELLQAEGLFSCGDVNLYRCASGFLQQQINLNKELIVFAAVDNVIAWMEKAIRLASALGGMLAPLTRELKEEWMNRKHRMGNSSMAITALDDRHLKLRRKREPDVVFALHFDGSAVTDLGNGVNIPHGLFVAKQECRELWQEMEAKKRKSKSWFAVE